MLGTLKQLSMTVKTLNDRVEASGRAQALLGPVAKLMTAGRATIAESRPSESVKYKMEFFKPMSGSSEMEFVFKPQTNQTEVTVTVTGEKSFVAKAFCLFMSMDKMIGGKFEKALAELKTIAESRGIFK